MPNVTYDLGSVADWVSSVGSLAAVGAALYGYYLINRQQAADVRRVEKRIAYDLTAIILDIGNNIKAIERHFATNRNNMRIMQGDKLIQEYRVINPLIGLSDEGEYSASNGSTEILIKAGAADLWNDIRLLVNRNRALTNLMKEYRVLWDALISKMPVPADFTGTIGHIAADPEIFVSARGDLVRIDGVVAALDDQVKDTVILLGKVAGQIGPVMKAYFSEPFLHLGEPDESRG